MRWLRAVPIGLTVGVPIGERGAREMDAYYWLNLSGAWGFPMGNRLSGEFRLEIQNVTDEQDPIGITGGGELRVLRRGYQRPRRYRALVGVKF